MENPILWLLDAWTRRYVWRSAPAEPSATKSATVVTGASEGIGLEIARRFAAEGHRVVLVARRREVLEQAAIGIIRDHGVETLVLAIDINQPDAAVEIEKQLQARGWHADILVNNAGFGLSGIFSKMPLADIEALMSCNIVALTKLSRHFLPAMLRRRSGGLINVASLAGFTPGPYQAMYYASKAYVISLTLAIAYETRGRGIRVSVLAPGPVETAFHARMNADNSFYRRLFFAPTAELVAAAAYRGFRWHRRIIVPGIPAKILSLIMRIAPAKLSLQVTEFLLYPREEPERPPSKSE